MPCSVITPKEGISLLVLWRVQSSGGGMRSSCSRGGMGGEEAVMAAGEAGSTHVHASHWIGRNAVGAAQEVERQEDAELAQVPAWPNHPCS